MSRNVIGESALLVILVTVGVLGLLGYSLFVSMPLLLGPSLTVTEPRFGAVNATSSVVIAGTSNRVNTLWVNDTKTPIAPDGSFKVVRTIPAGYTTLTVRATDRFGRTVTTQVPFISAPSNAAHFIKTISTSTSATSTVGTTTDL